MAGEHDFAPLSDEEIEFTIAEGMPGTNVHICRELRASRAAMREAVSAIERLRQDIRDWTHTARGLRARSANPDRDPACPSQAGIDESERVLSESHAQTAKLRALVAHVGAEGEGR